MKRLPVTFILALGVASLVLVADPAAQAKAWKATFTPTVLFLGPEGQKLAEPLVGVAVPDFYGAYLDERLVLASTAFFALR